MELVFLALLCCQISCKSLDRWASFPYLQTQTVSFLDALPLQISSTVCCYCLQSLISCCDHFKRFCVSRQKPTLQDLHSATRGSTKLCSHRNSSNPEARVRKAFVEARRQCWHMFWGTGKLLLRTVETPFTGIGFPPSFFCYVKKKWFSISETSASKTTPTKEMLRA